MKVKIYLLWIFISLLLAPCVYSQFPGGIAPAAWYRADGTSTLFADAGIIPVANNGTVQQWNSVIGSFPLIQTSNGAKPVFSNATRLANFNPTVTFDGSNDWMQSAGADIIDRADGSVFAAGYMNQQKRSGFTGFHASMDFPGLHVYSNYRLLFFTSGGPGYQGLSADVLQPQRYFSAGTAWQNGVGGSVSHAAADVSLNGIRTSYASSNINNVNTATAYRDLRIGADNNYGSFSGELNEILVFENRLTTAQMDQVETYLAIKYGTTYANGIRDYKTATGVTVWDATANNGYHHNIAGIAHDAALYQKQAWSTNPGQQVLIGVGGLANTNAANSGSLTNGQYLIWGDNGAAKLPTTAIAGFSGISHRFPALWKVQNNGVGTVRVAWPKGFRNLTLIQSTDATISAGDTPVPMFGNEITINGIVYNYADVSLSNGHFFTFGAAVPAPGGVTAGLTQWYRADIGLLAAGGDGSNITSWTDYTRGTVSRQIATAPVPVYRQGGTNYFNFNPGVNFTAIQQMLGNISTQTLENTNFDIFTLTKEGMTGGVRYFNIGMNNTTLSGANWDNPGLNYNGTVGTRNSTGGGGGTANPGNIAFATTIPSIMYHTFTNTSIRKGLNGAALGTPWNISARGQMTGGHIFGSNRGTNPPNGDDWGFTGHIGEVIIYGNGNLSATDRNKVDAYLALKYGITLPSTVNYLNAAAAVVWNSTTNSVYHHNVAGIAHDEASAFNQKQAKSVNAGQQLIIGTTGLANTNALNTTSLTDGQYLIWGDNGLAKVPSVSITGVTGINYRFAAVWKVQNTGTVATVRVLWPTGLTGLKLVQSTDPSFATVTSDHTMSVNTITVNGIAYNYADVTLVDGIYFTFGAQLNGPGGVGADLRVWLRSDAGFAPESWTDFSGHANNYTQTHTSRQPFVAEKQYNFNPVIDFGTTGSDARFMVVPSGRPYTANGTNSTIFTAVTHKSASGYTDIIGFGGTTTTASLTNANAPTLTKLNANVVMYPRIGTPALPATALNKLYLDDASFTVGVSGVKYGKNGQTATVNEMITAGDALHNNGSILGSQPEVRNGTIGEVIAYQRDLTEPEKQRVRTYVAIKYGLTLPHNYIASNASTIFWDQAMHTGYTNNIAGIARDDHGSLNQRQSWSINSGNEVLISTTGLANHNATNGVMLADQQALLWGDNGLPKSPTVPIAGITDVNYRFASIWKVQNTGSVGTVRIAWPAGFNHLKLIQSTDDVINASDVVTDMTATQTINGISYAYADVTLSDGQYFTFAVFVQGPGGVTSNLSYWYRADKFVGAAEEDADVNNWTDFTSGATIAQLGDNDLPKFKKGNGTYFNFNPGINYTATAQTLGNTSVQTVTALNFDIYTLTKEGLASGASNPRIFSSLVDNVTTTGSIWHWDAIGLNVVANNSIERVNTARTNRYMANPGNITYAANHPSIMYQTYTDVSVSKGLNGAPNGTVGNHTARGQMTGGHAIGSTQFSSNASDNGGFTGNIGELIIYGNGNNTAAERNKIETYLAIKYGLTLHNSNNYTSAQNTIIWDATANSSYYHNIAGIGNDFLSALHQKQSRSQHPNSNGQLTIALGEIAATNAENTGVLSNGQFLVWGDNNNTQSLSAAFTAFQYAGSTDNGRRMNRIWKVQNTGVNQEVLIRFPKTSVGTTTFTTGDPCAEYVIVFASDAAFTTNVVAQSLTDSDTDYDVQHTFPAGTSYFTYAKVKPWNQGQVSLPSQVETTDIYANACDIGEWKYFRRTADNTQKLLGVSGYTNTELNNLDIVITPEGTEYSDGARHTRLMPRISTVLNGNTGVLSSGKVRVYYSPSELDASIVPSPVTNGWFKYEGDADEVMQDIYADGVFEPGKARRLIPDVYGIEDGVHFVEFHNISSFSSFVYLSSTEILSSVLPVSFLYLTAEAQQDEVLLSWATAGEVNNKGFEVEHSVDGINWQKLGFVPTKAVNGNSTATLRYFYSHNAVVTGKNYYRLKQIDQDGKHVYSPVSTIAFDNTSRLMMYPNPATSLLTITGLNSGTTLRILNMSGQAVKPVQQNTGTVLHINVAGLPTGSYLLQLEDVSGKRKTYKFIKK